MKIGEFEITAVSDGRFKLDGGSMFGVVPKVIWNKLNKSDGTNRITLGLNSLLVCGCGKNIIIDTGIGIKPLPEFSELYELKRKSSLFEKLSAKGLTADDIDIVILSHLHFDHCGGNTVFDGSGGVVPAFPNARYYVQRGEWEAALKEGAESQASYLLENFVPLDEAGQVEFLEGDAEIIPGISVKVTGGHTQYHQIVFVDSGERRAVYWADLVPTCSHIKTPYIMGYDLYPMTTAEQKRKWIPKAAEGGWVSVFVHDPRVAIGIIHEENEKKYRVEMLEKASP